MSPRIVATIECRMTSSRLPGKVLMPAGGKPLLQILIERLKMAPTIQEIVIATTVNKADDPIVALGHHVGVGVFRGSEDDVLARVCGALAYAQADVCVEITGDCPLIDPDIVEVAIQAYIDTADRHPYISNSDPHRSVPTGLDVQVFSVAALQKLSGETTNALDREHVSYGFYRPEAGNRWSPRFITHQSCKGSENLWCTLDYREDYELIRAMHEALITKTPNYRAREIITWIRNHPALHDPCVHKRLAVTHVE